MTDVPLILRIVSSCAVVGLVLYGFVAVSRHRLSTKRARPGRLVSVIETTPLAQNASIYVVRVGERYHVVGHAAGGLSLLTEIEAPIVERCATARKFAMPHPMRPRWNNARTRAEQPPATDDAPV